MRSKVLVFIIGAIVAFSALPAWSGSSTELEEIVVLSGTQYLGDPPYPTVVEYLIDLREDQLERANYAALEFKAANVCCGSRVTINGREYTLPYSEDKYEPNQYGKSVIPIPVGSLLLETAISFEAQDFGPNGFDDFGIADVYLVLSLVGTEDNGDGQQVAIDFKTNDQHNVINPRSMGRVWVAILSDSDFDAQQVDPGTVALGRGGAAPDRYVVGDRNRDRLLDLVLRFRTPEIGLQCSDAEVTLTGKTYTGENIYGTDSIKIVGCK